MMKITIKSENRRWPTWLIVAWAIVFVALLVIIVAGYSGVWG